MMSAVIRAGTGDIEALGMTLASLVPAVAEGLLRDAAIVDGRDDAEVRAFAEAAGAGYVSAPLAASWQAGTTAVKGPWYLLLEAGDVPAASWTGAADRFMRNASPSGAGAMAARFTEGPASGVADHGRRLLVRFTQANVLTGGLIVPRGVVERGSLGGAKVQRLAAQIERHGAR